MNTNSESTANSIKFAPMPMSALLANLTSFQKDEETPDTSFSTDASDDSFNEIISKTPSQIIRNKSPTFQYKVTKDDVHSVKCVKKNMHTNNHDKENIENGNGSTKLYSAQKLSKTPSAYPNSEIKKRNHLMPEESNVKVQQNKINSSSKKTPEKLKIPSSSSSVHKKTATPKIKSGIRRFTPCSSHKQSHSNKKVIQQTVIQNRDKVRCELFRHNPQKEEQPSVIEPPPVAPVPVPVPVPETPMNRKPMPTSYAATPSYPQGVVGNNSKILFKTTSIKDKKYMFIKKLGTGGSSEVYKVLEVGTSCEYAVKCVYLATDQELAQGYINEVRLLRELQNSDRVVRLYDYEYDRQNQFLRMVIEVGETDLSSFLRARGAGLPPALVLHYWEEMLHAVNYIHSHGVIHADLKPANFLLVCGRLKLIDFGIASAISGDATSVVRAQAAGTYSYISPEALMGGAGGYGNSANIKISFRSDVWSLGCILYSMVYGRTPFGHIPNLAKLAAILDPNHKISYPPADHVPSSLIATLKWCLTYNARSRPSVQELLNVKHLQLVKAPLPQTLLDKLRQHVTPDEFKLLQQAQI